MGYFSYLYLIQSNLIEENEISLTTEIFGAEPEKDAFFSWSSGERPESMYSYGNDTIFANYRLNKMDGYPIIKKQKLGQETGGYPTFSLNADLKTKNNDEATVLHILLPKYFVPRKDISPFIQPKPPYAQIKNDRVILTWPIVGSFEVRFCITPLSRSDDLQTIDLTNILGDLKRNKTKHTFEFNFQIFKYKFERQNE